ncbi:uracil-DNA glycosylase [Candidatus Mycoplasma pogonae]
MNNKNERLPEFGTLNWKDFILQEKQKPYFQELWNFLEQQNQEKKVIFPTKANWFRAFQLCPFAKTQVVILGQDPYHTPGMADGLAFSTHSIKLPPSLKNIFQELKNNYPETEIHGGQLDHWAKQGVLLLNRVLTVEQNLPTSHYHRGWEIFTKNALQYLVTHKKDLVFVLLGSKAQEIITEINLTQQHIIQLSHPSPFSARISFLGSGLFLKINKLVKHQIKF